MPLEWSWICEPGSGKRFCVTDTRNTLSGPCNGRGVFFYSPTDTPYFSRAFTDTLVSSSGNGDEGLTEMKFTGDHPDADVLNLYSRPTPHDGQPQWARSGTVLDFTDSRSGDSGLSTIEPPRLSQSPIGSLKSLYRPRKPKTYHGATRSILPFALNWRSISPPIFHSASLFFTPFLLR